MHPGTGILFNRDVSGPSPCYHQKVEGGEIKQEVWLKAGSFLYGRLFQCCYHSKGQAVQRNTWQAEFRVRHAPVIVSSN
jgi:hypothetical protein